MQYNTATALGIHLDHYHCNNNYNKPITITLRVRIYAVIMIIIARANTNTNIIFYIDTVYNLLSTHIFSFCLSLVFKLNLIFSITALSSESTEV